jgi:hypothetical protein
MEIKMSKSKDEDQGVTLDEKGQEQPKDKERALKKDQRKDDELQPLRERSGF